MNQRYSIKAKRFVALPPLTNQQTGVALIISLIMLVLMSLVGLAGIKAITNEERLVAQSYDRALAFQAAESALREVEAKIESAGQPAPAASSSCASMGTAPNQLMVCGLITTTVPRWISSSFTNWASATSVGTGAFTITPQYFVEYLGAGFPCTLNTTTISTNCKRYRISARANPDSERASVMLQSIYATY
jgi:type IV pilus assembly protein PilX